MGDGSGGAVKDGVGWVDVANDVGAGDAGQSDGGGEADKDGVDSVGVTLAEILSMGRPCLVGPMFW